MQNQTRRRECILGYYQRAVEDKVADMGKMDRANEACQFMDNIVGNCLRGKIVVSVSDS